MYYFWTQAGKYYWFHKSLKGPKKPHSKKQWKQSAEMGTSTFRIDDMDFSSQVKETPLSMASLKAVKGWVFQQEGSLWATTKQALHLGKQVK